MHEHLPVSLPYRLARLVVLDAGDALIALAVVIGADIEILVAGVVVPPLPSSGNLLKATFLRVAFVQYLCQKPAAGYDGVGLQ